MNFLPDFNEAEVMTSHWFVRLTHLAVSTTLAGSNVNPHGKPAFQLISPEACGVQFKSGCDVDLPRLAIS